MSPKITVVVPTLNRPSFAQIAVDSVLAQDGGFDCEIVISNNGANSEIKEIFETGPYKNRIRYLETEDIVPMPEHWEWATQFASGEYLMVLPDRRLLKQGALKQLILAMDSNQDCGACCCCDEWLFESGRLQSNESFLSDTKLSAENILKDFERGLVDTNCLPLGLNCILRNDVVNKYRGLHGKYFDAMSPDFRSAFNLLFTASNVYILAKPLIITTGFNVSNGGKAYRGDRTYFKSLGRSGSFGFMPECLEGNVWASIYEDYLRSKYRLKGDGDYKAVMSKRAMHSMMTEEIIKMIASKFNADSWSRYRDIKKLMRTCGWNTVDDLKVLKAVAAALKQFLPHSMKRLYRYAYALIRDPEKDVLRVAGF